jgi:ABC-type arginine transport system ATPase subunit
MSTSTDVRLLRAAASKIERLRNEVARLRNENVLLRLRLGERPERYYANLPGRQHPNATNQAAEKYRTER